MVCCAFFEVAMSLIQLTQESANPSAPGAGLWTVYVKSDGLYLENSSGVVIGPLGTGSGTLEDNSVTYAKLQNVTATARLLGRKTAGAGDPEELTLSEVLDLIGSAAQGDILYRGAAGWARLAAGTSGKYLKTLGPNADPIWDVSASKVVQVVNYQTGAVQSAASVIPLDDSSPQSSEGTQVMSLAVTPTSATNNLLIQVLVHLALNESNYLIAALFQDAGASALATAEYVTFGANGNAPLVISYWMAAGTTSETTFKVRCGTNGGGTWTLNGFSTARKFGGTFISSVTITEVAP
jgi:hypothetical protein